MKPTKMLVAGWRPKIAVRAAFVVTLAAPIHALAGCGCSINDIACQNRCEMAETNAKNAREARVAIDNDSTAVITEFKAARDRLWRTDPSSADFTAVVNAYKAARNRKVKLLLVEYGMALPAVVTNGSGTLKALDEKYLVPQNARDFFHQFAMSKLKKTIGNPNFMGGRSQGYDAMDEFGGGLVRISVTFDWPMRKS